jgi:hypothetical protein
MLLYSFHSRRFLVCLLMTVLVAAVVELGGMVGCAVGFAGE